MRETRQISLASIFYLTTLVAVFLGMLAPLVAAIQHEKRQSLIVFSVVQWVLFAGAVAAHLYGRKKIERQAGKLLYRTSFKVDGQINWAGVFRHFMVLALLIPCELFQVAAFLFLSPAAFHPGMLYMQLMIVSLASRVALSVLLGVDSRDVELFENGYAHGVFHFVPWSKLKSVRPGDHLKDAILVVYGSEDSQSGSMTLNIRVWPSKRDEICEMMSQMLENNRLSVSS